jgi:hypothetical protein
VVTAAAAAGAAELVAARWRLHGLAVAIEIEPELRAAAFDDLLGWLPLAADPCPAGPPDLRLTVVSGRGPEPIPDGAGPPVEAFGLSIRHGRDVLQVTDGCSSFVMRHGSTEGRLSIHPSFPALPAGARLDLLLVGLNELLAACGCFDLHAGALVQDGRGHLLVGESGSGKTTTALSLVTAGWHYLSDDAILLRDARPVEALSFRRRFNVADRAREQFPALSKAFGAGTDTGDGKRFVDIDGAIGGRFVPDCVPEAIIYTRIVDAGRTTLRRLGGAEALTRLLRQSPSLAFRRQTASRQLALLGGLVAQASHHELAAGRDVRDRPDRLAGLLEDALC